MGDRTTPMKFGPEWLRNLSRERTGPGSQSVGGAQSSTPPIRPITSIVTTTANTTASTNASKVLLAKLRYGREELLALYDRQTAEAPPQLKSIELLYHPRGKPPYALSNNFEDDTRDSVMRNNAPIGSMSSADRYGPGRGRGTSMGEGRGRGLLVNTTGEGRGRARLGYVRQTSLGSDTFRAQNWHSGGQRTFPGAPDDDPNPARGLWNNGNGTNPPGMRPNVEQADWAAKIAYRKNRQNHTNWRQQQNRDEGEEWRSPDAARRGQEKWEREWPERSNQEKPWTSNRRQWGGDNNEDALPEWALESTDACGGTFDSSGAFHGYSNDDSNVPKAQEPQYPLARSQTHGSFTRSRTVEEGSEEWWASEKAKKLSAKRFDASEVKFKKPTDENSGGNTHSATNTAAHINSGQTRDKSKLEPVRNRTASKEEADDELQDEAAAYPIKREEPKDEDNKDRTYQQNYPEHTQPARQRIDMLMRTEEQEQNTERGSYKSVMMTPNNNHLRQKHQNIGTPTNDPSIGTASYFEKAKQQARLKRERDEENQQKQQETKLVEDMLDMHISEELQAQFLNSTSPAAGNVNSAGSMANQLPSPGMQMRMNPMLAQGMGLNQQSSNSQSQSPGLPGLPQGNMMRPIGITNSMLNASLGLPIGSGTNMGLPLTSMPPPPISNSGMLSSNLQGLGGNNMQSSIQQMQSGLQPTGLQVGSMQSGMQVMQGNSFQPSNMPVNMQGNMQPGGMNNNNNLQPGSGMSGFQGVGNSLFGATNSMGNPNEMTNHGQQGMYPMHGHGLQQPPSQSSFTAASLYGNMMQPPPTVPLTNIPLTEQWYYEDPKKTIQGPFTSKEMFNWYRAGFFGPELMVRRACESGLRPLANYGLMPFGPMDILPPQFNQIAARFDMRQTSHDNSFLTIQQVGLGPEVESLWSQPPPNDMMWIQQPMTPRDDNSRVNNLSMYFWDQPSGMPNSLLPEGITKEMKTEDEILAQMRASQGEPSPAAQSLTFISDSVSPEDAFTAGTNIAPNLEELQKLIGSDIRVSAAHRAPTATTAAAVASASTAAATADATVAVADAPPALQRATGLAAAEKDKKSEKAAKVDPIPEVSAKQSVPTKTVEAKPAKQPVKVEEKSAKNKEVTATKTKTKKPKDEIKEDPADAKVKEEEKKNTAKRSDEPSPTTNKREDRANKKDLEKEKMEWLKEGFTIVKGTEKKDAKKKEKEEARATEEAEKKKKVDEKRALLEAEKNRSPEPVTRRQQLEFGQVQRQTPQAQVELAPKKAPWSAQSANRDGLALSDIQRLEREKKLEQMKEQQQMMQVIAQQQAVAAQREQQEMQVGQLGWAKKKQPRNSPLGQNLAEIQAEARMQAAMTVALYAAREEALPTAQPVNVVPWTTNGGGFWDSPSCTAPASASDRTADTTSMTTTKAAESKPKKKVTVVMPAKKEASPSADFDTWCTTVLSNWKDAANIDIPTFVTFLRDIESPFEVKDYVKCYLGDTKEASDFARQFLERRSRLLRVGMVAPSDDLCSPAAALTPRTNSGSDYTEIKSKANKKTKKNKMLKVDARILGFSVTASEDRINIGDIDTV